MDADRAEEFERVISPHMDAVYSFARWLTSQDSAAEDMAHEALIRAFRHYGTFRGTNFRAWLFAIVRNTCYSWLARTSASPSTELDEDRHGLESDRLDPEVLVLRAAESEAVGRLLDELPVTYREVIVLRELEGLSYQEISSIVEIPLGTVMSRLARGRRLLARKLAGSGERDGR